MSELDFLLNRKKSIENNEEKREKKEDAQNSIEKNNTEKKENTLEYAKNSQENEEKREERIIVKEDTRNNTKESRDPIEDSMEKFLDKDPKIGVWSYPAFLVLQYLYNTKPGFRMSKVAKEALELGLKQIYPELFKIAEKVSEEKKNR
ncbi:hypothetical protein [Acidianus brierleyi]|uniref:hypothetical protein n=1 Tax=Acidianus brierleyi TaxID=41673 RepID=UPI001FE51EA0|nr:hypothetical protein [Acidianus brierleyi]